MKWERPPISKNPARILPGADPHPGGRRGAGEQLQRTTNLGAWAAYFRREWRALCAWWRV